MGPSFCAPGPMQIWFEFYTVIGGATATLLGLLFVAVSINVSDSKRGVRKLKAFGRTGASELPRRIVGFIARPVSVIEVVGAWVCNVGIDSGVGCLGADAPIPSAQEIARWRLATAVAASSVFFSSRVRDAGIRRLANGSKPRGQPHSVCNCDHRSIVLSYKGILGVNA